MVQRNGQYKDAKKKTIDTLELKKEKHSQYKRQLDKLEDDEYISVQELNQKYK